MEQKAKILTVAGKGGVGKTSICASIVRLLVEQYPDKKILAIDADPAVGLSVALGVDDPVSHAWRGMLSRVGKRSKSRAARPGAHCLRHGACVQLSVAHRVLHHALLLHGLSAAFAAVGAGSGDGSALFLHRGKGRQAPDPIYHLAHLRGVSQHRGVGTEPVKTD